MNEPDAAPPSSWPSDLDPAVVLRWYLDAGVDLALDETPVDRYALTLRHRTEAEQARATARSPGAGAVSQRDRASASSPSTTAPPALSDEPPTREQTLRDAAHRAQAVRNLEDLRATLEAFHACPLRRTATNTVVADGNPESGIMIIGEAPGAEEDRQGLPFVGASGQLLNAMLASIGLDRKVCYITNVVPWRPPGNRKPTGDEVALCQPFLERHIELIAPRAILAVGGLSAQCLTAQTQGITRLRGHWKDYASPGLSRPVPVLATFHPAFLLRNPAQKRLAWRDLLAFREKLVALGMAPEGNPGNPRPA